MDKLTFSDLLNEWLASQKNVLKEGHILLLQISITSMIMPILGDKKISEMTSEDITDFTIYRNP